MKLINNCKAWLAVAACAVALTGCIQPGKKPAEAVKNDLKEMESVLAEYQQKINQQTAVKQSQVVSPGLVKIPRSAPWLADPLEAGFKDIPFETALNRVLQGRPVLYTFNKSSAKLPAVSFSPSDKTIKDHLDTLVNQADLVYRVNKGVVVLSDTITREYQMHDLPGYQRGSAPTDSLGASDRIGNTSQQQNIHDFSFSASEELTNLIVGILERTEIIKGDEQGSQEEVEASKAVSFSQATNTLFVTAKPSQIAIIDTVVENYIERSQARAVIDMTVYEVELSDGGEQSVDINLIRQAAINAGIASKGSALLNTTENSPSLKFTFNEGNRFDGSDLVLRMLKTKGSTSVTMRRQIQLRHNQLYTHRNATITPYVEKIAIENTNTGNTSQQTPTLEVKETSSGVAMNIFPTISGDQFQGRFVMNRASIVSFEPINAGDGQISGRLPIQDKTDNVFYVSIKDGESTLISSFETEEQNSKYAKNPLFFTGAETGSNRRLQTIILISVKIVK